MTTRLSRERASARRERALDHLHTPDTGLAGLTRFASKVTDVPRAGTAEVSAASGTGELDRVGAGTRSTRVSRLRARRVRGSRRRRGSAALGAAVFAGLGSVTLMSSAAIASPAPAPNSVQAFGRAPQLGSSAGLALHAGIVGIAGDPAGHGYWLVGADGGVFAFGQASFFGSTGGDPLNAPIVGMAATPDGRGYWLVGADGGVFAFGHAPYFGSIAGVPLNAQIIALVPTPDGHGYWLVGADGGIFAFGSAEFHGSADGLQLASPIVGAAATASGHGYWLVGADGGVFAFGDAQFRGAQLDEQLPAAGIAASADGKGYWVARADGSVTGFGTPVVGNASTLDTTVAHPNTVGIAASTGGGYWLAQGELDPTSSIADDPFLACTRGHESDLAGGYQAVSPGGTYRGAYQFDQSTWNNAAELAQRPDLVGVDPAVAAPADQDLVAIALFHAQGPRPWGNRCLGLT